MSRVSAAVGSCVALLLLLLPWIVMWPRPSAAMLSWLDEAAVTVAHEGLPSLPTKDLRTYSECLLDVLSRVRPSDRPQRRLCFKETDRQAIDAVLSMRRA